MRYALACVAVLYFGASALAASGTLKRTEADRLQLDVDFGIERDGICGAFARLVPAPNGLLPVVTEAAGAAELTFGTLGRAGGIDVVPVVVRPCSVPCRVSLVLAYSQPLDCAGTSPVMSRALFGAALEQDGPEVKSGYLIVTPDEFYGNVLPLAEWKRRRGFEVWVRRLSETGSTRDQIRDYVRNAYSTWTPRPAFVLLVGAVSKLPTFVTPGTSCVTDHIYACVDGTDYLADLFVGRLPAANASELDAMVAKTIGYEATPYVSDPAWFGRGLMVGTSYQEGGSPAVTALVTLRQIREFLLGRGFGAVDTVFYPPTFSGRGPVDTAVNRGVLFVNGRGWGQSSGWGFPQFQITDVYGLNNGWKLPVVTSIYCGTGNFQANPCFGEAWLRAGTPTSPKGAVAFWGSSYTGTSTRWNNCMDYGIYHSIFRLGTTAAGPAMYAGKLEQLANFPLPTDSFDLRLYFHVYNLLGDPSLEMWTGALRPLRVIHASAYPVGASSFDVEVRDGSNQPVSGASVCLYKPGEVHELALTDGSGLARFAISTADADTMYATVTGRNLQTYNGVATGTQQGVFVGHEGHTPVSVAPGSLASIGVTLRNFGTVQTASNVTAVLRSGDAFSSVTDSVRSYGAIAPGARGSSSPFAGQVSAACTSGQDLRFLLHVTSDDSAWLSAFDLPVSGPTLSVRRYAVHDGNGVLDPGEQAELSVVLHNRGVVAASGLSGTLRSVNPNAIQVIDSTGSFGSIGAGDSGGNSADRFSVQASAAIAPGRTFTLRLALAGTDGFSFTHDFVVTVGQPSSAVPLGPDYYGYYAYDDTDAGYAETPAYSWVEVDAAQGGQGTRVGIGNDRAVTVGLPFSSRFYGRDYTTISVSDNGYFALGNSWLGEPYNWHIPSASGPDGFVAPFWDDFRSDTLSAGGVHTWYDVALHRFVVEWSRCLHVHGFRSPVIAEAQTFEAILFDPQHYPTATGDGALLFQYHTVQNDDSASSNCHDYATVGVQSPGHTDGLEYTFAGAYPAAAAPLAAGRAVKFTTNPPDTFFAVAERPSLPAGARLRVSGNPARARLRTEIRLERVAELRVVDALGRVCLVRALAPGRSVLSLETRLPAGAYSLMLVQPESGAILARERVLLIY